MQSSCQFKLSFLLVSIPVHPECTPAEVRHRRLVRLALLQHLGAAYGLEIQSGHGRQESRAVTFRVRPGGRGLREDIRRLVRVTVNQTGESGALILSRKEDRMIANVSIELPVWQGKETERLSG